MKDITCSGKFVLPVLILAMIMGVSRLSAQKILFDFDSASNHTSLPISLTEGGITAHFAATGQGYSIQDNTSPVVPSGFTGRFLYPNSIYASDLLISFNKKITDFSIWYSCQELACDDAATMKVTAYLRDTLVGSNTRMTANPGTWPVDTLSCSFSKGFDSVVVHYFKKPPTCTDYGVIYLCDNMRVSEYVQTPVSGPENYIQKINISNPISRDGNISFALVQNENIHIALYDLSGRMITGIFKGRLDTGEHHITWHVDSEVTGGVYLINITGDDFKQTGKVIVVK